MTQRIDEKGKHFTEVVSKEMVPVILQSTVDRIHGFIYIRGGERLKDELNHLEQFLAITNAEVFGLNGELLYRSSFITLNRDQIVWIIPANELQPLTPPAGGGS
jgi:hypothetical protein